MTEADLEKLLAEFTTEGSESKPYPMQLSA